MRQNRLFARFFLSLIVLFTLSACFESPAKDSPDEAAAELESDFSGSVGDGPISDALVEAWTTDGRRIANQRSDVFANYSFKVKAKRSDFPLVITARGGTDLVTNAAPDFELVSTLTKPGKNKTVNLNPFSTLAVQTAQAMPGGLTEDNVATAHNIVMDELSFGLDSSLISNAISGQVDNSNVASVVKASEALGEMLRRTSTVLASGRTSYPIADIIDSLSGDLVDGVFDGLGAGSANPRVAALSRVVSAQVMLETMTNSLHVNGVVAVDAMDAAISVVTDGTGSQSTRDVTVTAGMLTELTRALRAAAVLGYPDELAEAIGVLQSIQAGATSAQVQALLPAGLGAVLDSLVITAAAATDAQIDEINSIARADTPPPIGGPTEYEVTITVQPGGTVFADTPGTECTSTCTFTIADGELLTLSAQPDGGFTFAGWGGACSGTAGCALTVTSNRSVTAEFATDTPPVPTHFLSLTMTGSGTVVVGPDETLCDGNCIIEYDEGQVVTLSSNAGEGFVFDAWSGDCAGFEACTLTMSADKTVQAAFSQVPLPAPSISLSANPIETEYGGYTTLTWTTNDASACTAFGSWDGSKELAGDATIGPLTSDQSFGMSCDGPGGSTSQSVQVNVMPPHAPVIAIVADPLTVVPGGTGILSWTAENADSCTADGDWAGSKPVSGSETVGPVNSTMTFILSCEGPGGMDSAAATITVQSTESVALSGQIDSSLIMRDAAVNKVYVFSGNTTPDDIDGDEGDPLAVATAVQSPGSCAWTYEVSASLQAGTYTIAFTSDAADDQPQQDDNISFAGTTSINLDNPNNSVDFLPTSVIQVGPTRPYTTVRQAAQAAGDGDVIEIDAGTYLDDIVVWRQNRLTLRGVNGRAHLKATQIIPYSGGNDQQNGMGIWVTRGNDIRVENIEFSGARVPDANGSGIRLQGGRLDICNSYFHDNENGILGSGSVIEIAFSEFDNNGLGEYGRTHNIYISDADKFVFRNSYSHHANIGHNLKSRARENHVLYSRLMDEETGNASYAIDIPNGGLTYVIGNLVQQGTLADNSIMVNYGAEGLGSDRSNRFYAVNNTLVNDRGAGTFFRIASGTEEAKLINNLLVGNGTVLNGSAQQSSNLHTSAPGLLNIDAYDYKLSVGSPAIDAGSSPGLGSGRSLKPVEHYVHKAISAPRIQSGPMDVGAYELEN